MEYADARGSSTIGARKSLRAFKRSPRYKALLRDLVSRRETPEMPDRERRRLRLDRITAQLELDKLEKGESPSEYDGLMALRDPLRGLHDEEGIA